MLHEGRGGAVDAHTHVHTCNCSSYQREKMSSGDPGEKERKKSQQEASGCEVPFVPASNLSRFKQLSTRRQKPSLASAAAQVVATNRAISSPNLQQPGSVPPPPAPLPPLPQQISPARQHPPLSAMASAPAAEDTGVSTQQPLPPPPFNTQEYYAEYPPDVFTNGQQQQQLQPPPPPQQPQRKITMAAPPTAGVGYGGDGSSGVVGENNNKGVVSSAPNGIGGGSTVHPAPSAGIVTQEMTGSIGGGGSGGGGFKSLIDKSHLTVVDETKDHPGRRKNSGFFQPIKHLSGRKRCSILGECCCSVNPKIWSYQVGHRPMYV